MGLDCEIFLGPDVVWAIVLQEMCLLKFEGPHQFLHICYIGNKTARQVSLKMGQSSIKQEQNASHVILVV